MACVTTFVRLVEVKLAEMESVAEGTGSLEQDVALMEGGQLQQQHADCVRYRAG